MKKYILTITFYILLAMFLSTCASVKSQGVSYFEGKKENDLIQYYGYNGTEINSSDSEYDKILFFTNKMLKYQMSKVNTVRYKSSRQTQIMIFSFWEFSDGCLTDGRYHLETEGIASATGAGRTVAHRNDNAIIRPKINEFNNTINRNRSFPTSQRTEAFNRSNIGDVYYLYEIKSSQNYMPATDLIRGEGYTANTYGLWRINVFAEDRSETESWIVAIYDERFNRWLSGSGNTTITQERANGIINEYINNGYTQRIVTEGYSMYAYIKNDKVLKVEEVK
jgi:hypothetical protein